MLRKNERSSRDLASGDSESKDAVPNGITNGQGTSSENRRRFKRLPMRAPVVVHHGGRFQSAKITEYSAGGLQLDGTFGLFPSDTIEVALPSGTRLPGKVAWALGRRVGIVFPHPLSASHPAMIELAKRRSN
jgi:hypothetical protein